MTIQDKTRVEKDQSDSSGILNTVYNNSETDILIKMKRQVRVAPIGTGWQRL